MKLVCIGDSFTAGDELNDRTVSWPYLLGNLLSADTINMGRSGAGNERIIKRTIDTTFDGTTDIIVVAWSNPQRAEIADEDGVFTYWPSRNVKFVSKPDRANLIKAVAVAECENVHTWSHRRWLRDIILLQAFFKQHNQKYIMIQSHESQYMNIKWLLETDKHVDLSKHIDTEMFLGWPVDGIVEWAGDAPRGPNGHPLELGHQRIADKIYEHIRNLGWLP